MLLKYRSKFWISFVFIVLCLIFSLFLYPNIAKAATGYDVVFSEVMWVGSSMSTADEWLELRNTTSQNIDLIGWQITALKENSETDFWEEKLMLEIPSGIVPARGYFLISSHAKDHQFTGGQSILNIDPDLVDSAVSLSNDKLQLKLYDGKWDDDGRIAIDMAGDGEDPQNFKGNNDPKFGPDASMYRYDEKGKGDYKDNWRTTDTQENLDSGILDYATPRNSGKPKIISATITPLSIDKNQQNNILITVEVSDPDGFTDIQSVTADLFSIGGQSSQILYDNGTDGDVTANDGVYSFSFVSQINVSCGLKILKVSVKDQSDLIDSQDINLDIYQLSDQIVINEIMPWPSSGSSEEFIELYNKGSVAVDLYKWQIDDKDGGSSPYTIAQSTIIESGGYLVFKQSTNGIHLNNSDSDQARLLRPDGKVISQSSFYSKANKDQSYNLTESGDWQWSTTLTAGAKNIITQQQVESSDSKNLESKKSVTIAQARSSQEGQTITIEGLVTVLPGSFDKHYFYIQDDSGGIQIYSYYERFPNNLGLGDWVKISGELSFTNSGKRIKTSSESDVDILKIGQIAYVWELSFHQANNGYEGQLVKVKGKVDKIEKDTIYLDDGIEKIRIFIDSDTGISYRDISEGDIIEAQGIITIHQGKNQLQPRFQNDIDIIGKMSEFMVTDENNVRSESNVVNTREKWYDIFINRAQAAEVELTSIQDQGEVLGAKISKLGISDQSKYINQETKEIETSLQFTESLILFTFVILIILIGELIWSKRLPR